MIQGRYNTLWYVDHLGSSLLMILDGVSSARWQVHHPDPFTGLRLWSKSA